MDRETIRKVGRELLGLDLTEADALRVAGSLDGVRQLVLVIERVKLPYLAEPFLAPALGEAWLESWDDVEGVGR